MNAKTKNIKILIYFISNFINCFYIYKCKKIRKLNFKIVFDFTIVMFRPIDSPKQSALINPLVILSSHHSIIQLSHNNCNKEK